MDAFARPITVFPDKSQPALSVVPYAARGVWSVRNIDTPLEDGSIFSDQILTLGVRLSEFAVEPVPGDRIVVDGTTYLIDDTDPDGQGGSTITLKSIDDPRLPK